MEYKFKMEVNLLNEVWNKDYKIRIYEVSNSGKVHLPVIFDFLQDTASEHASHLGVGLDVLRERNISWFLTRLHIKFYEYPRYGDTVTVRTWPRLKKKVFAYRDFRLTCSGRTVAAASSVWCLVDLENRNLLNPLQNLPQLPEVEERAIETSFPAVRPVRNAVLERKVTPGITDMDLNGHVNNSAYVRWAIETVDFKKAGEYDPESIDVVYKGETTPGDVLISRIQTDWGINSGITVHTIENCNFGSDSFRMKIDWKVVS
jgi:acyl-ACP thioesterase